MINTGMKNLTLGAVLGLAVLVGGAFATPAQAVTIFDNGAPDLLGGLFSDFDQPQQAADDFQLQAGASTITDVHWYGLYAFDNTPPALDNFRIRIFGDNGGVPLANFLHEVLVGNAVNRTATANQVFGFDVFSYDVLFTSTPIVLNPLTTYWLSIVNDTSNENDVWVWASSSVVGGNAAFRVAGDGTPWLTDQDGRDLAFSLTNDGLPNNPIPEPSTMLLLGTGLAGIVAWRARKQQA